MGEGVILQNRFFQLVKKCIKVPKAKKAKSGNNLEDLKHCWNINNTAKSGIARSLYIQLPQITFSNQSGKI